MIATAERWARDYTPVTERTGVRVTREALEMALSRYRFAAARSVGRDVLEVACGAGQGLALLQDRARTVIGGDVTSALLGRARAATDGRVALVRLDAQRLPFAEGSFDVVLLNEAIYYLDDDAGFIAECRRVLRPGGVCIVTTVNREWEDFNPSPFSRRYRSADELRALLAGEGLEPEVWAAFPADRRSLRSRVVSRVKRFASRHRLIPGSMERKELLKRLFLGALVEYPECLREGCAAHVEPTHLEPGADASGFKILHAVGSLPGVAAGAEGRGW